MSSTMLKNGKYVVTGYEKRLNRAMAQVEKLTDQVADEVRTAYVIPFCRKKNLKFVAGMGQWMFLNKKGDILDTDRLPRRLRHLLVAETFSHYNDLGSLMQDYAPPGFPEKF